jgi:hypothetical protein
MLLTPHVQSKTKIAARPVSCLRSSANKHINFCDISEGETPSPRTQPEAVAAYGLLRVGAVPRVSASPGKGDFVRKFSLQAESSPFQTFPLLH